MLRHAEAMHIREKNYECKYCKKKFSVKDNCSRHIKKIHEKTQQEEFKKLTEERKLQIEEIKLQALREESQRAAKMKEKEHELAMKRAQYEDQLREKRKEADLQKEIQAQQRIEQAKRGEAYYKA